MSPPPFSFLLSPALWLWLDLVIDDRMQHDLVDRLWRVDRVALAPIVADSIRENRPVVVERGRRDGPARLWVPFETMFGVLVPEVECAVASSCAEGALYGVEVDRVDGEAVCCIARAVWVRHTVAFE